MLKIDIIASGRMKGSFYSDAALEFQKRILWPLRTFEYEGRTPADDEAAISKHIEKGAYVIALDERGRDVKSTAFAAQIGKLQDASEGRLQFVIGGADGLSERMRGEARMVMSLGVKTWPHLLARIMLLEQIYRAQQILGGHPYHRE